MDFENNPDSLIIFVYIYIHEIHINIYIYNIYSLEQRTKMKGPGCLDCYYSKSFCFTWSKVPKCSASLKRAAFFSLGVGSQTTTPKMDGCIKELSHLLTSVFYLYIVYILKHHLPSRPVCFGSCPQSYPALVSMKPSDERLKKRSDDALQLFAERIRKSTANNWLAPGTLVLLRTTSVSR